jgi:ADP-ribose pyrophosphatase YjhB (NUDIX family)
MYIKIYFGDKPLFLCDAVDETVQPFIHHDDAIFIDELNTHTVKSMVHEMELSQIHAGVFYHADLGELKKAFFKKFTVITAAGGLVQNEEKEILLIFRKGRWDLPKGKLDKGETEEDCAIREITEETGVKNLKVTGTLPTTYHTYHEGARFMLKESHWFRMQAKGEQQLKPQAEEDIKEVKWVPQKEIKKYLSNTFATVKDLLSEFVRDDTKEKI